MKIAVQDANVLIDLEVAGLFDLWFQLGIETHTSCFIRKELEDGGHMQTLAYFKSHHVQAHDLTYEELEQISELESQIGSRAGFNDCSVLFLAIKLDAMLVSGDRALRDAGQAQCIEVHGTLWIFDLLVSKGEISGEIAASKLEYLISMERYLPPNECTHRIAKWRKS